MSKFTKTIQYRTQFEGDEVTVNMRRLKRSAMIDLTPHLPEPGETVPASFINKAAEILPEHIISLEGLTDADGNNLGIDDIQDEAYFVRLISEIVEQLFLQSNLTEAEEGNSDAQPNTYTGEPEISVTIASPESPAKSGQAL